MYIAGGKKVFADFNALSVAFPEKVQSLRNELVKAGYLKEAKAIPDFEHHLSDRPGPSKRRVELQQAG